MSQGARPTEDPAFSRRAGCEENSDLNTSAALETEIQGADRLGVNSDALAKLAPSADPDIRSMTRT